MEKIGKIHYFGQKSITKIPVPRDVYSLPATFFATPKLFNSSERWMIDNAKLPPENIYQRDSMALDIIGPNFEKLEAKRMVLQTFDHYRENYGDGSSVPTEDFIKYPLINKSLEIGKEAKEINIDSLFDLESKFPITVESIKDEIYIHNLSIRLDKLYKVREDIEKTITTLQIICENKSDLLFPEFHKEPLDAIREMMDERKLHIVSIYDYFFNNRITIENIFNDTMERTIQTDESLQMFISYHTGYNLIKTMYNDMNNRLMDAENVSKYCLIECKITPKSSLYEWKNNSARLVLLDHFMLKWLSTKGIQNVIDSFVSHISTDKSFIITYVTTQHVDRLVWDLIIRQFIVSFTITYEKDYSYKKSIIDTKYMKEDVALKEGIDKLLNNEHFGLLWYMLAQKYNDNSVILDGMATESDSIYTNFMTSHGEKYNPQTKCKISEIMRIKRVQDELTVYCTKYEDIRNESPNEEYPNNPFTFQQKVNDYRNIGKSILSTLRDDLIIVSNRVYTMISSIRDYINTQSPDDIGL